MNILTLEFLDKILSILKSSNRNLTAHEIKILFITDSFYSLYKKDFQLSNYIPVLIKDGYIKEVIEISDFDSSEIVFYTITPEGLKFIGYINTYYSKLSLEEENKLLRLSQIELNRSTVSTNRLIARWTIVIGIGTAIAAVYYLKELFCPCSK
jgi:hypothetical protein